MKKIGNFEELKRRSIFIMKFKVKYLLFLVILFLNIKTEAQVHFTASAKGTVSVGEQFALSYEVNADGQNFHAPAIKDFDILSGPNQSSSTSIQIINGRTEQSVSFTFTYYLRASKEGKFTIPAASIKVNGKTVESNPVVINVVKGSAPANAQQSRGQGGGGQTTTQNVSGDEIFIKAFADKSNPYQGEQVTVTYKIYTKVNISQFSVTKTPTNAGFWSQPLTGNNQQPKQTTEVINGEKYIVAEIQKNALFAQRSGKLTIEPLELECIAQVKTQQRNSNGFFNDPFFDNFFNTVTNVKKTVKSNVLSINVNPLPGIGKPDDFSGSVGSFTLKSDIDRSEVKTNDAVNLKITISGKGSIKLIDEPKITFPPDVEKYSSKSNDNVNTASGVISGTKTFEYLLIPRAAGVFQIPSIRFSYFDPESKTYKTLTSPEYTLKVAKGEGGASTNIVSSVNQEEIKYIGKDIKYIETKPFALNMIGYTFFGSNLFYILLLLPLILFILFIIIWREELKKRSNVALMKLKKATKIARKRLKNAAIHLKENKQDAFYEEISLALFGYTSDKLGIHLADLSMDNIQQKLIEKNVNIEIIKQLMDTLNHCEFARFAPSAVSTTMDNTYNEALVIIEKIENELR